MARADISTIKELVTEALGNTAYNFETIEIDDEPDFEGFEYLRVILTAKKTANLTDEQLDAIASGIEKSVGAKDDRFPSVFFPGLD